MNFKDKEKAAKREENKTQVEEYDYSAMKQEYEENIQVIKISNNTLNFTDVEEEESVKDAVKSLVESKKKLNCSLEEQRGIGRYAKQIFIKTVTVTLI